VLLQALFLNVDFVLVRSFIVFWNWYVWCFSFVILDVLSHFRLHPLDFFIILWYSLFFNFINFFELIIITRKIFYFSFGLGLGLLNSAWFFSLGLILSTIELCGQLLPLIFNEIKITLVRLFSLSFQWSNFVLDSGINMSFLIFAQNILNASIPILFLYALVWCSTSHWSTI
jgi:hypothetical protein